MTFEALSAEHERIATAVVHSAVKVHKALGPGLLESVYEVCLAHELRKQGFQVRRQESVPIVYDNVRFEEGFKFDLLVNDLVLCENKAVQETNPIYAAQLLTHLKLMDLRLGFLLNFNVQVMKEGIQRVIH
jgi:GxxExxY protein